MKLISVIIPVFNSSRYLRDAVHSVVDQSNPNIEIIVVDDASTDDCLSTIRDFPGIKSIRLTKNRGGAAAQNAGVRAAKGKWVTFLDSDDLMAKGSLAWRLAWAKENPKGVIVGGLPAGILDKDGRVVREFSKTSLPVSKLTLEFYQRGGHYPVANWLYLYRQDFIRIIGYFNETFRIGYDFDFQLRVLQKTDIPLVASPTVFRRFHPENISVHKKKGKLQLRPEAIKACKKILHEQKMKVPSNWAPWELSFRGKTPAGQKETIQS